MGLLMVLLLCILLVQLPAVQNAVVSQVLSHLTENIKGKISFSKMKFLPFRTLMVKDFLIMDDEPLDCGAFPARDTVAYAREVTVTLSLNGIKGVLGDGCVRIDRVALSDGVVHMVTEGNHTSNFKRLFSKGNPPKPIQDKGDVFNISRVVIRNLHFTLSNVKALEGRKYETGIDWNDLDLIMDKGVLHGVHYCDACISAHLDDASVTEKSGISLNSISASAEVRAGNVTVSGIRICDPWSDIDVPYFSMSYENARSFRDFVRNVSLDGTVADSHLDSKTLEHFVPMLHGKEIAADVSTASFSGPVDALAVTGLSFRERGGTSGAADIRWSGLMDRNRMRADLNVRRLDFTTAGAGKLVSEFMPASAFRLDKYAPGERFTFSGRAHGPANDLEVSGQLQSTAGEASARLKVTDLLNASAAPAFGGAIETKDLDLGRLLNLGFVHGTTLRTVVEARNDGATSFKVDSLKVERLNILGYDYTGIAGAGLFSGSAFDGRVICSDPNLNFIFQGIFNLSKKTNNAIYKFFFNLGYADLNALNLDKRGTSKASLAVNANFMRVVKGDLIGDININGVRLENDEGMHNIGNIAISSHASDNINRINLNSSFAEGTYVGTKPVIDVIDAVMETTLRRNLPALAGAAHSWKGDNYRVNFRFADSRDLLSFVMPGLYIAEGTSFKSTISSEGKASASVTSQRLAFKDKYLKDLKLTMNDISDTIRLKSSEISLSGIKLKDSEVKLHSGSDHIDLIGSFDNGHGSQSYGTVHLTSDMRRDADGGLVIGITSLPSYVLTRGEKWELHPSDLSIRGKDIMIHALKLSSGEQSLSASGGWSRTHADTLTADMSKLSVESICSLLGKDLGISGSLSGKATVFSTEEGRTGLTIGAWCESTMISGKGAGKLALNTEWQEDSGSMTFTLSNDIDGHGRSTLEAGGSFFPSDRRVNAKVRLDGLDMGYAGHFVQGIFSEIGGRINGEITMAGPIGSPSLYSRGTNLENALLRIDYTDVPYYLNGPFHVTDNGVFWDDITAGDRFNGKGIVTGGILFEKLRNLRMDTHVKATRIEMFNASEHSSAAVYGNITGTGDVALTGPFSALILDVNARTEGSGNIHIPLRNMSSSSGTDLLTFKEPESTVAEDPYETMMRNMEERAKSKSQFGVRLRINARPEVECSLEIDKETGNVLAGRGYGRIDMDILPHKPFSINGDYSLNDGNFHFNALGIASRDFGIRSGSSIKFNGDLMNSDLDIEAMYSTKASLANLISDTTSVSSRRTVECGLQISEKLNNPKLSFSIDIPDLDPTTKSLVETSLNTDDKIQKQFLALLVTNNFLPSDQSGIVNNSSMLFSNVTEIMAGQLNNILQRLDIPLDLGLNYQPNEGGTDIFDVAVSTQLFNNRVTVNGNIGNRQYGISGTNEDVVGDLDIELKLDKAGSVRMSLFSHSADQYTNYLDNTQRNGIGIGYQKEFNTLTDLFRELFSGKKREQRQADSRNTERITITIDSNE